MRKTLENILFLPRVAKVGLVVMAALVPVAPNRTARLAGLILALSIVALHWADPENRFELVRMSITFIYFFGSTRNRVGQIRHSEVAEAETRR